MSEASYYKDYTPEKIEAVRMDRRLFSRLMRYLKSYRMWMALSMLLLLVAKLVEVVVPIFIGQLVDRVLETEWGALLDGKQHYASIASRGGWIVGFLAVGYLLDSLNIGLKHWIGQKALLELRQDVFHHMQRLPVSFFDHQSVGRLMSRTIHDVDQINALYSEGIIPLIGNVFILMGVSVGITYLNWQIALICFCAVPGLWLFTRRFREYQRRCFELVRAIVSALNTFVQEQLSGASTVWGLGSQRRESIQFQEINHDYYTANIETIRNFSLFTAGIEFCHSFVLIMIFVGLFVLVPIDQGFQAGQFFTFSLYALMVFRPIADLAERYNVLQSAMAAGQRVFDILDREVEDYDSGLDIDAVESIIFEDVWFAYRGEEWVLKGLNLEIVKGESLAVVGMTGAGKTTLVNLLLRFYEVSRGELKVNGRNIQDYKLSQVRALFSVVLQDPVLFSRSLADNIMLGGNQENAETTVDDAIDYVGMRHIADKYVSGMNHQLSGRGAGLSAGERQLVSLARASAHSGRVYILDEATSNIDSESEVQIRQAMAKMTDEHTSIVIAHRLSTIQHATRIAVLHQGQVVEQGAHTHLLKKQGIYEKLYRLQFSRGS